MKLIKQHGRKYKDKDYFKYIIVIPNKLLKQLKWKKGDYLNAKIKNNKLIIEKK